MLGATVRLPKAGFKAAKRLLELFRKAGRAPRVRLPATPGVRPDPAKRFRVELPGKSVIKNPMTPKNFNKLPDEGLVDPHTLRTAQKSAGRIFKDGRTLEQMVDELRTIKGKAGTIEPTLITVKDGKVFALDHRRLIAHRIAGVKIRYRKATEKELRTAIRRGKFESSDGLSIKIRDVE